MYVFSMFYRVSTAIIATDLTREFGLSPDQLSLLGAGFFYAFALAQLPLGPALDRLGPRRIVSMATALGALGSFVFAGGHTWTTLLLGRVLMGLGMAPVLMGSLKLFSAWFSPGAFGTVGGLIMAIGGLGALLASSPLAGLVALLGWRPTFVLFGALTLMGTAAILWVVRDRPDDAPISSAATKGTAGGLGKVITQWNFWAMAPMALAGYASIACLQGLWAGPYFMESLSYSRAETGNILFALGFTGVVGTALAGYASDRVFRSRKWVLLGGALPSAVLMVPLLGPGAPSSPLGWAAVFAAIGLSSAGRTVIYAHAKESMPPELTGTAITAVNFFIMVGPALMQQAMGFMLQAHPGNYRAAFLIPIASLFAGGFAYLFTRDTHPGA
jgi:MFS family permease